MENTFNILQNTSSGIVFNVKLAPNSSFSKITGFESDYARIKISAPALENRANKALIEFCSEFFGISKSKISIISGKKSKIKKILIKDADFDAVSKKLMFVLHSFAED